MDRNQAKEFYPIMQAFAEGRVIECRTKPSTVEGTDVPNDWTEMKEIEFWNNTEYRIKPEPTYRPFKDAKECRAEMLKHQPFGWLISQNGEVNSLIIFIDNEGIVLCKHWKPECHNLFCYLYLHKEDKNLMVGSHFTMTEDKKKFTRLATNEERLMLFEEMFKYGIAFDKHDHHLIGKLW